MGSDVEQRQVGHAANSLRPARRFPVCGSAPPGGALACQACDFRSGQQAPATDRERPDGNGSDLHADELPHLRTQRFNHPPHLAVAPSVSVISTDVSVSDARMRRTAAGRVGPSGSSIPLRRRTRSSSLRRLDTFTT